MIDLCLIQNHIRRTRFISVMFHKLSGVPKKRYGAKARFFGHSITKKLIIWCTMHDGRNNRYSFTSEMYRVSQKKTMWFLFLTSGIFYGHTQYNWRIWLNDGKTNRRMNKEPTNGHSLGSDKFFMQVSISWWLRFIVDQNMLRIIGLRKDRQTNKPRDQRTDTLFRNAWTDLKI